MLKGIKIDTDHLLIQRKKLNFCLIGKNTKLNKLIITQSYEKKKSIEFYVKIFSYWLFYLIKYKNFNSCLLVKLLQKRVIIDEYHKWLT
jgi:hypothetical protein